MSKQGRRYRLPPGPVPPKGPPWPEGNTFAAANAARITKLRGERYVDTEQRAANLKYDWQKKVRGERAVAGLCIMCGKEPPEDGTYNGKPRVSCRPCADQANAAHRGEYLTREDEANKRLEANGRCTCGLLLPCDSCLPTAREMAESRRAVEMPGSCE